jgi:glycosyltransferase involved in cell wall biosynthesis
LVSVIIPCWNAEALVSDAIGSALSQTHANLEVIVIDDGSTDRSVDVLKSFGDRIRWESGPNRGACVARNRGLEMARGEFIQYLDSDDLLHPTKIAVQLSLFESDPRKILYCGRETHSITTPSKRWLDIPSHEGDEVLFALSKIITCSSPLYRKNQLVTIGGYRTDLDCAQDYDLNLRLALAGFHFHRLDKILLTVRRRDGSISSDSLKVLRQMRVLWHELVGELRSRGQLTTQRSIAIARCFANAARVLRRHGHLTEAELYLAEAQQIDPRGVRAAYGTISWIANGLIGPSATEALVSLKRRVSNRNGRPQ